MAELIGWILAIATLAAFGWVAVQIDDRKHPRLAVVWALGGPPVMILVLGGVLVLLRLLR